MTLEILTSDSLSPVRHGFFTRAGGASSGVFAGLNCGRGSSDQANIVAINRERVARALGLSPQHLIGLHQVHSSDVVHVDGPSADGRKADALVSNIPGLALTVLTADCAPVLFADRDAAVIGAAHAGWRGAHGGVLEATLAAMESLGAQRDRTVAVIGPTIARPSYEVGPEFVERFVHGESEDARFFSPGSGDKMHFDLPAFALSRLRRIGIGHAEWTRHDTYADPSRFYSYRRATHRGEADYGRLISAIRL